MTHGKPVTCENTVPTPTPTQLARKPLLEVCGKPCESAGQPGRMGLRDGPPPHIRHGLKLSPDRSPQRCQDGPPPHICHGLKRRTRFIGVLTVMDVPPHIRHGLDLGGAVATSRRSRAMAFQSWRQANRKVVRIRCRTQVWVIAS